jgi:hypothetical protein
MNLIESRDQVNGKGATRAKVMTGLRAPCIERMRDCI